MYSAILKKVNHFCKFQIYLDFRDASGDPNGMPRRPRKRLRRRQPPESAPRWGPLARGAPGLLVASPARSLLLGRSLGLRAQFASASVRQGPPEAQDLCLRNRCPLRLGSSGTPVLGIPTAPQPFAASLAPGCWPSDSPGASHSGQRATPSETGRVFSRALVVLAPPPTLVSSLLFCPSRPHGRCHLLSGFSQGRPFSALPVNCNYLKRFEKNSDASLSVPPNTI